MQARYLLPFPVVPTCVTLAWLAMAAGLEAQSLGTVSLPASLAEAGTQVQAVLNQEPGTTKYLAYSEGPAVDADGTLFFAEITGSHRIWKVPTTGQASVFASGNNSNGMEFDPQGRLVVCQANAIALYDKAGARSTLAVSGGGFNFKTINDLTIGSTGAMFFTNWDGNDVFHRDADGKITRSTGYTVTNGIEWIEEKQKLYLAQDGPDKVFVYDVGAGGALSNGKEFAAISEPDGMTMDALGNLYVASWQEGKVIVFDPDGKTLGSITLKSPNPADPYGQGGNASNCVFGGPGNQTLYITGDGGAYKVSLKVAGRKRPGSVAIRLPAAGSHRGSARSLFRPRLEGIVLFAAPGTAARFDTRGKTLIP